LCGGGGLHISAQSVVGSLALTENALNSLFWRATLSDQKIPFDTMLL
jgi:hypothetical protein